MSVKPSGKELWVGATGEHPNTQACSEEERLSDSFLQYFTQISSSIFKLNDKQIFKYTLLL